MNATRVLLADDHPLILSALRLVVERIPGLQVVAEAGDGRGALALAEQHRPDLVIMDISMRELNGIEATGQIKAQMPATVVLIISSHTSEEFVRRAIIAGASGYVVKDCAPHELGEAVRAVMRGHCYFSPSVSRHLVSAFLRGGGEQGSSLTLLTARQREILQMIAEGKSTKQIAHELDLGTKTVETHRAALMERLAIHDVAHLVLFAVSHGLVSVDRPPAD